MQSFMVMLLTCSVTMSALALFYMAVTPLLAKRYSEKGRYYAWLIIVIGLIIPFRPHFDNAVVKVDVPSETTAPIIQIGNGTPVTVPDVNTTFPSTLPSVSWWQIAAAVWLAGVIAFLAYHIIKHYCFVKMVKRWSENVTDKQPVTLLQSLKSEMGISTQINLYRCSSIGSPMMIGFVNPRILLPKADFAQDELRFILKHELVHYKRKDLYYKSLVLIATAIHWFNPIVYLMAKAIDVLCETSCDTEVVRSTDADMRQHYSETIIGVVKYQSKLKTALSTNFYGGKKGMKNRISSIMDTTTKKAGVAVLSLVLVGVMATGFVTVAYASNISQANDVGTITADKVTEKSITGDGARVISDEEIKQMFAEFERNNADVYSIYEKYGLTYNNDENRLYYNGKLVRYFEDNQNTDGTFSGVTSANADGSVDVHSIRNSAGELTGIEAYSQAAFDTRTSELQKKNGIESSVTGSGISK